MKATQFAKYFDFSIYPEYGTDEYGEKYNFRVTDDEGVLADIYIKRIDEIKDCFDCLLEDYVDGVLVDNGIFTDTEIKGIQYKDMIAKIEDSWVLNSATYDVVKVLSGIEMIEDDVKICEEFK